MGILRANKISGLETPVGVGGAVYFDGTNSYLSLPDSEDLDFGSGNFTVEGWVNMISLPSSGNRYSLASKWTSTGNNYSWICNIYNNSGVMQLNFGYTTNGINATDLYSNGGPAETGKWFHIAYVRDGNTLRQFVNGVQLAENSISGTIYNGTQNVNIGRHGDSLNYINGYISNLRILKGTALYTANFTPPVNELQPIQDTVLLCCNNPDSAGAVSLAGIGTSKTITVNGNAAAVGLGTSSPGLTRDITFGTQYNGVTKFDTLGYFTIPSGTTEQRGRGRGLFGGGDPGNVNTIAYINIQSTGNAINFGNLTVSRLGIGGCSSSTRGIFGAGYNNPTASNSNIIDYITISSTANAINFGNLATARHELGACSSSTRGVFGGGVTPTETNSIEFFTIASLGNATSFGSLTVSRRNITAAQSPTRGIFFGGRNEVPAPSTAQNVIDYITFSSTGNAITFGNLTTARGRAESVSSSTRAVCIGGENPTAVTTMEFITIATLGNSQNFGTASSGANNANNGASNSTRGVFHSAFLSPASVNTMDYITIATTGNSIKFGDLTYSTTRTTAFSDSHGGIEG